MDYVRKNIERKITAVSNIKTFASQVATFNHLDKRRTLIDLGPFLDNDIQVPFFHKVIYGIQVHLVVSDTGSVGRDISIRIPGFRRDVDIRSVTGQKMKAMELFLKREDGI